ncbi:MAG: hypothetical protein FJ222_11740 [Lentisphaerae bacterium]|nr:hypothetical protein [Lentisphaerota bacterium]
MNADYYVTAVPQRSEAVINSLPEARAGPKYCSDQIPVLPHGLIVSEPPADHHEHCGALGSFHSRQ